MPRLLLTSSWMWHLTRWDGLFLGTYLVTDLGAPPIANQFVGVAMFAPMLLGVFFSLRRDLQPRRFVFVTEAALLPVSVVMAVLVATGGVQLWMIYPFELAYGFGGMVNMTAQRELLFRIGGPAHSTRILNVELTGMASAMMLGPLIGGMTIAASGLGAAFAVPAALLSVSVPLLWYSTRRLQHAPSTVAETASAGSGGADWRLLRRSRALALVLLVTVICNLCYFAFLPLVPVIAEHLDAGPAMAGVIGATAGVVQLAIAAALIARPVRRPLTAYTSGVALCLCCLGVLAYTPIVSVALATLAVAGIGQALFGSTQALLPVASVAPHERAAALGLLTTTIGVALPAGMVVLGVASSLFGAQRAMLLSALVGLSALLVTFFGNRAVFRAWDLLPTSNRATGVGAEGNPVTAQPKLR